MHISRLALESTLATVRPNHISDVIVTNTKGSPIILKNGVLLGTYQIIKESVSDDPPVLPVASKTKHETTAYQPDVIAEPTPHVSVVDYPESKSLLLQTLSKLRQAIALPREQLRQLPHCTAI